MARNTTEGRESSNNASHGLGIFASIMEYEKEPSPFHPEDPGWKSVEKDTDFVSGYLPQMQIPQIDGHENVEL